MNLFPLHVLSTFCIPISGDSITIHKYINTPILHCESVSAQFIPIKAKLLNHNVLSWYVPHTSSSRILTNKKMTTTCTQPPAQLPCSIPGDSTRHSPVL